ncbi:hypothetical protein PICST_64999 [Scheffersomyces stipitis CBS 6054]|uniref:DUF1765-domain-containing protein n=1 Tax=Scheffersomyces stipitis (strain ATCC 58785 / CBS 6054 / NBRC 10063 / NRRL Y-11545) TaxID=322104 RepID=A3GHF7_PICST|nr:hypothetical protein PICST_64999 [Scheffersomyces stipitis CBS 6054]EAZ62807.2 hypothetical protein PICST_64999 [Scheffersomyces stipitis CBS 6054]
MSNSHENDKLIKSLLKQYKKLELELNKFNSRKYNHSSTHHSAILKGNILRTSLLPFLRTGCNLHHFFPKSSKIYRSLINVIISILIKWWSSLLGNMTFATPTISLNSANSSSSASGNSPSYSSIPASDKSAYLECISRIITREEWASVDPDFLHDYERLLVATLDYCIDKMSTLKTMSLSNSAFIGKVFAYSFFKLPNVSNALLFLLNVKQIAFEETQKVLDNKRLDPQAASVLFQIFPPHLHYLIKFNGIANLSTKGQKRYMNCTPPPKHPVNGIKDPNGNWVRRWYNIDSNVFNSFFRHYVSIVQSMTAEYCGDGDTSSVLKFSPGFTVIFSHIIHIFQLSITRISKNSANKFQPQNPNISMSGPVGGSSVQLPSKILATPPSPSPGNLSIQSDVYHNSITKIFKTLRDILYSTSLSRTEIDSCSAELVKYVDRSLITIAKETSVYDYDRNGLILMFFSEFISHVNYNNNNDSTIRYLVDWEFWLGCNYMMIKNTDHVQIVLKNFSFLFNVWDMIPQSLSNYVSVSKPRSSSDLPPYFAWLENPGESFKLNFILFLISNETFERFVTHWNPIVRSYYLRLLVWRVIGINNYQSSIMIHITKKIQEKLNRSYDVLHAFTSSNNGLMQLDYRPDNPLVNRKFGILPINVKDDFLATHGDQNPDLLPATQMKSSELRKAHPFEVFDEAIYTCSVVPPSPAANESLSDLSEIEGPKVKSPSSKNSSLVNSIGRLFKILSTDDTNELPKEGSGKPEAEADQPQVKRNGVSFSSLSTSYSSLKSRSSSPSLMSFRSSPTSVSESSNSSVMSDTESVSSVQTLEVRGKNKNGSNLNYNIQPPELSRLPPEITRPIYKFDIIVDHDSMNEKYAIVHHHNNSLTSNRSMSTLVHSQPVVFQTLCFPICPRMPLISIFINSDTYNNKFYINDEEGLLIENFHDEDSIDNDRRSEQEARELFSELSHSRSDSTIKFMNLGKSLNELNLMIDEFKNFLKRRIEIDQFNQDLSMVQNLTEFTYFKKIIPFLSVDGSNEAKLLNAN